MLETEINEEELDDDNELYDLLSVEACVLAKKFWCSPVSHQSLNWQSLVQQFLKEGSFRAMYHMRHESFCELAHLPAFSLAYGQYKAGVQPKSWR
jgi:hypothetical protein